MTTLTPNRIIQQGDEYIDPKGTWKPVPKDDYGLQVMFTKYPEVRRPSEAPQKETTTVKLPHIGKTVEVLLPKPISPISEKPRQTSQEIADPLEVKANLIPMTPEQLAIQAGLPTVISPKAHEAPWIKEHVETHPTMPPAPEPPAPEPLAQNGIIKIAFPKPDPTDLIAVSTQPIWTGRNGTFTGYGLEAMIANDNIMLSPVGKRGIGNGCIQFPKSVIPQLVDWLLRQQK